MKNSPLLLEQYCVTAVKLDANVTAKPKDSVDWHIQSKVELATHKDDPRRWKVDLTVTFCGTDEANSPYKGSVSFTGLFAVDKSYPDGKVRFLVETNAPSVLFGAVRETVANLTARGPWPMVTLPTQSFYKAQTKAAAPEPPAKPLKAD
jgi:preprotein translocase subunit SecB